MFDVMHQGKTTGLICQGFNPLMSIAYKGKTVAALSKLKFLVSVDPIETDTVRFWENHGEYNDVDTAAIQTEVFMLPIDLLRRGGGHAHQLEPGRSSGSGRRPTSTASRGPTSQFLADLFQRIRKLYEDEGGTGGRAAAGDRLGLRRPGWSRPPTSCSRS